uniref:Uncharacterized protein n=1 Tax=Glossina pallidipes TaxID=7398 RepID=A0A1A9Z0H5_GLOPL
MYIYVLRNRSRSNSDKKGREEKSKINLIKSSEAKAITLGIASDSIKYSIWFKLMTNKFIDLILLLLLLVCLTPIMACKQIDKNISQDNLNVLRLDERQTSTIKKEKPIIRKYNVIKGYA